MALEMQEKGYQIICLWSKGFSPTMKTHVPNSCKGKLSYAAEVEQVGSLKVTADLMRGIAESNQWTLVACVCGGEAGVDLADALSEELGLVTNGTHIPNRRDKKVQQELVKATGLRSVRQAGGGSFAEVEEFLQSERYPVIVKPLDSAGSDGVMLCHSFEEAKDHFLSIIGKEMINGGICDFVLCQEFLIGREYVVDMVSRNGVHKVVMTWLYDKRPANGSAFVYFGDIPVDPGSPECLQLIPYAKSVLDAIGVKNGPSHGEIM
jgi:biotin carboxylase